MRSTAVRSLCLAAAAIALQAPGAGAVSIEEHPLPAGGGSPGQIAAWAGGLVVAGAGSTPTLTKVTLQGAASTIPNTAGQVDAKTKYGAITGFATAPNGNLWYIGYLEPQVGTAEHVFPALFELTPAGGAFKVELPGDWTSVYPISLAVGSDGAVWVTTCPPQRTGTIFRYAPGGGLSEYPLFSLLANITDYPTGIVAGPDGALWFTNFASGPLGQEGAIGRLSTGGEAREWLLPPGRDLSPQPTAIVVGSDGALWFTEQNAGRIGRITTGGQFQELAVPAPTSEPRSIALATDGNVYFTDPGTNSIGQVTPGGQITEYPLPTPLAVPNGIAATPDGAVWFTEESVRKIGRLDPKGQGAAAKARVARAGRSPRRRRPGHRKHLLRHTRRH